MRQWKRGLRWPAVICFRACYVYPECEGRQRGYSLAARRYWLERNKLFKAIDKCSIPLHQFTYIIYRFASSPRRPNCVRVQVIEEMWNLIRRRPEMVNELISPPCFVIIMLLFIASRRQFDSPRSARTNTLNVPATAFPVASPLMHRVGCRSPFVARQLCKGSFLFIWRGRKRRRALQRHN